MLQLTCFDMFCSGVFMVNFENVSHLVDFKQVNVS